MNKIRLEEKFSLFDERWQAEDDCRADGQEVKIVKV